MAGVEQNRVEDRAEDIVLTLVPGAVSDANWTSSRVTGEVVARRLGEIAAAIDAIHDLQGAVFGWLDIGDELHELLGLPVQPEEVQRLKRERGVAHPGVAVVPVAFAPGSLGQRR